LQAAVVVVVVKLTALAQAVAAQVVFVVPLRQQAAVVR
jgi:hypothetical protein